MLAIMTVHKGVLLLLLLQFFTGITSESNSTVVPITPDLRPGTITTSITTVDNSSRSGPSSQSVQISCDSTVCPSGMDCVSINGTLQCADPCQEYTELNDDWRSTNSRFIQKPHCDRDVNFQGWYRLFLGQTSARIPEMCVARHSCGTLAPLWLSAPHPTQSGQIVNRTVCGSWTHGCCSINSHSILVKLCYGNYYVYKLVAPDTCNLAYCAEVNGTAPEDSSTTPDPSTATSASNQVTADITSTTTTNNSSAVEGGPLPDNSSAVEGDVRLNGEHSCSGRVEIFHRGVWGTVCDDLIINFDTHLFCRQLDCGPAEYRVFSPVGFLQGSESISFVEVDCSDNNTSITECRRMELGVNNCTRFASIICKEVNGIAPEDSSTTPDPSTATSASNQVTADITSTTTTNNSSAVEESNSTVVPITPDLRPGTITTSITTVDNSSRSGPSSQSVQISCDSTVCPSGMDCVSINGTLQCADPCQEYTELNDDWRSTNSRFIQKPHCDRDVNFQGWYRLFLGQTSARIPEMCVARHSCGTLAPLWLSAPHPTQSGQIVNRTVCGSWTHGCCSINSHSILVKLCYGNYYVYKLVAPDTCNLAYCAEVNGTAPEDSSTTPDPSTATSASNQVTADITSTTTTNNSSAVEGGPLPDNSSAVEGDVRLNGEHSCSGRVEIFHRGVWGTVCDDLIINFDTHLFCRQLDCGPAEYRVFSPVGFLQGSESISFVEVDCSDNNTSITECRRMELGVNNCTRFASIICKESNSTVGPTTPDPRPGTITTAQVTADITSTTTADTSSTVEAAAPVRLVNSNDRCSGRVEVYHGGRWGTVCDDGWDLREANVVCRQMDCGSARSALQNAAFGRGSGTIWLDNVSCTGSESKLEECRHRGFGSHNCGHNEDASVICEASTLHDYQLICSPDKLQMGLDLADLNSGLNPYSGHLASRNCSWARVQNNMVWYDVDAVEGACGNTLTTNCTHAIYSNTLFVYPVIDGSFNPVSIPFSCAYPLETDTSLNVAIRPVLPILGSGAKPRATMSLFRNSAFTETYPAGVVNLPLGSPLYVGVSVTKREFRFVVVLEECYASHSPDPHYYQKYYLIQNNCPTDARQVSVIESGRSLRARFSALLFLLKDAYRPIYLHCNISLCDRTRFFCVPSCQRRTNRSVSSSEATGSVTVGPITWDTSTK